MPIQGSEYEILYRVSAEMLARIRAVIAECEFFEEPEDWPAARLASYL